MFESTANLIQIFIIGSGFFVYATCIAAAYLITSTSCNLDIDE